MPDIVRRLVVQGSTTGLDTVKTEVQSVAAGLAQVAGASSGAGAGLDKVARSGLSVAGNLHRLRMSLDETYRMSLKLTQETAHLKAALDQKMISDAEHARLLDLVRNKYDAATIAANKNAQATLAAANAQRQFQAMTIPGAQAPRGAVTGGGGFRGGGGGVPPGMPPVDVIGPMSAVGGPALQKQMASQDMIAGMTGQMRQLGAQTKLTSFEVTNLGMQFNDIAVMAASGQNPMVLIMQQGMQLAQIMAMSSVATLGLKATLAALGTSLGQFLTNPLYLAVAAAAALAAAFTFLKSEARPLEDALEGHADILKRIEQSYKDAAAAATGYGTIVAAESRKVLHFLEAQERRAMRASLAPRTEGALPAGVSEPTQQFTIGTLQSNQAALVAYTKAVEDLRESGRDGTFDIIAFQKALVDFSHRFPELRGFAEELTKSLEKQADAQRELEPTIRDNTDAFEAFRGAIVSLNPLITQLQIAWEQANKAYEESVRAAEKAAEEEKRRVEQAAEAAERERERQAEYVEGLRFEQSILNETAEQQAVLNNLRQLGADATDEQKAAVEAYTRSIEQHNAAMEEWEEKTKEAIGRMDEFRSSAKGILSGAIEGGLKGAMDALADRLMGLGEDLIISGLFGKQGMAGGGLFGGLVQDLLGGVPEKPVATMNVTAGVVNIGGAGVSAMPAGAGVPTGAGGIGWTGSSAPGTIAGVPISTWTQEAAAAAQRGGVDPNTFLAVLRSEGLASGVWQSNVGAGTAHRETSYGPGQFLVGGGLGDVFQRQTGLNLADQSAFADPMARQQYLDFMIGQAKQTGWSPWHGAANTGISRWQGINASMSTQSAGNQIAPATTVALQSAAAQSATAVDTLTSAIGAIEAPINQVVPGLGSFASALTGLFGGNGGISTQAASAIGAGFGGHFAGGGTLGAGRWGVAGENGPEIIHGPASITPMQRGSSGKFNVNIKTEQGVVARVTNAQQNEEGDFDLEVFAEALEHRVRDKYGLRQQVSRWGRA